MVLFTWSAIVASSPGSELQADPARAALAPYQTASVQIKDAVWSFHPEVTSGTGVSVRVVPWAGTERRDFELKFDGLGQVVGIVAVAREMGSGDWTMVGLGIVSMSRTAQHLDYGLAFCQGESPSHETGRDRPLTDPQRWNYSGPLLSRETDKPFNMISVALPAGDSLILTLQEMTRDEPETVIETYQFINHCPVGGQMFMRLMQQQNCTSLGQLKTTPPTEPRDSSPAD
jgi:hypothetical protein